MSGLHTVIRDAARRGGAQLRAVLRVWNGDSAYARYLEHWRVEHGDECDAEGPLDRGEFFRRETERRWNGVRRCC